MRLDVRAALASVAPKRATLKQDALAGVPGAIASVPDGMASSVLAGVNPVHGLYARFIGPIAGGLSANTRLMVVTTTTAAALAAGSALQGVSAADRPAALFLITIVAGAAMIGAGLLRLGRYVRFVSLSVMTGFLTGVAANILLGQVPDLTGATAKGPFALAKAWDVLTHPGRIDAASLLTGLAALAIAFGLAQTRLRNYGTIFALVVPTLLTLGVASIARVDDVGPIPSGVPLPHLPDVGQFSLATVTGAAAIAVIVLIQGAGVSESAPNPDGAPPNLNRDFVGQGIGNLAAGLFRGQPVGGSVGQTALNVAAGARSRWAAIFSGIWMLVILVAFSGIVGRVAMPTLAAVLMYAAIGSVRVGEIQAIYQTGLGSQIALVTTFLATLFLPVAAAVGVGVALSLLLQLNREALDLKVVELVPHSDGRFEERQPPKVLPSRRVTLLDVYGSLYYAGARTLQVNLPDPAGARSPAVVLRLRGRTTLGATAFRVLSDYAERLGAVGGRLYLSGVDPRLLEQLERRDGDADDVRVFPAGSVVGESSAEAYRAAESWVAANTADR